MLALAAVATAAPQVVTQGYGVPGPFNHPRRPQQAAGMQQLMQPSGPATPFYDPMLAGLVAGAASPVASSAASAVKLPASAGVKLLAVHASPGGTAPVFWCTRAPPPPPPMRACRVACAGADLMLQYGVTELNYLDAYARLTWLQYGSIAWSLWLNGEMMDAIKDVRDYWYGRRGGPARLRDRPPLSVPAPSSLALATCLRAPMAGLR